MACLPRAQMWPRTTMAVLHLSRLLRRRLLGPGELLLNLQLTSQLVLCLRHRKGRLNLARLLPCHPHAAAARCLRWLRHAAHTIQQGIKEICASCFSCTSWVLHCHRKGLLLLL